MFLLVCGITRGLAKHFCDTFGKLGPLKFKMAGESLGRPLCCITELDSVSSTTIGVLFGGFGRKLDGDSWFTWFHHLSGKPIYFQPKSTPMTSQPFSKTHRPPETSGAWLPSAAALDAASFAADFATRPEPDLERRDGCSKEPRESPSDPLKIGP